MRNSKLALLVLILGLVTMTSACTDTTPMEARRAVLGDLLASKENVSARVISSNEAGDVVHSGEGYVLCNLAGQIGYSIVKVSNFGEISSSTSWLPNTICGNKVVDVNLELQKLEDIRKLLKNPDGLTPETALARIEELVK